MPSPLYVRRFLIVRPIRVPCQVLFRRFSKFSGFPFHHSSMSPASSPHLMESSVGTLPDHNTKGAATIATDKCRSIRCYDLIVLGAGSGGIACSRKAAELGNRKIAIVENGSLGGTCVNVGCVPKKVMWNAANLMANLADMEAYGICVPRSCLNWGTLKAARDAYVAKLNAIYNTNLKASGVDLFCGKAQFIGPHSVAVCGTGLTLHAEHIVIATGGRPIVPSDVPGAHLGKTSDGFFKISALPKSVVIAGAGYIAVELAGILAAMGCQVTMVLRHKLVLRNFDEMLSSAITESLLHQGVEMVPEDEVSEVLDRNLDKQLTVHTQRGREMKADELIWAVGREPNTDLNLGVAGVKLTAEGHIKVDDFQNTTTDGIYALGDVCGKWLLTPVAIKAGRKLAVRLFGDDPHCKLDYSLVPTVVFSHPPTGTVGLSEEDAVKLYGREHIRVYRASFVPMFYGLSPEKHKIKSHVKMVSLAHNGRVIGIHLFGQGSDEMLQGFAVAMRAGATKETFDETIAIHPTSSEELVLLK